MIVLDTFDDRQALFAVIDGHGGHAAADYVAENLGRNIVKYIGEEDRLEQAIRRGFLVTDKEFLSQVKLHMYMNISTLCLQFINYRIIYNLT
jgi:serine/threonine protein phosphatase PrpC